MSDIERLKLIADMEAEGGNQLQDDGLIHIASGLVLKPRKVPPMILDRIQKRYPDPTPPKIKLEEKEVWVSNPDDPDYVRELERLNEERGAAIMDVLIGMGTEIVSVPATLTPLEDDTWLEEAELFLGFQIPRTGLARYVAWLKFHALQESSDFKLIADAVTSKMGVTAAEVQVATTNFQG